MTDIAPKPDRQASKETGIVAGRVISETISILPLLLMFSFLIPILISIGPLQLMPHRIFLILVFFPLLHQLLSGRAGPLLMIDYALVFSALWASVAIFISQGTGALAGASPVQATGIYWVEFFGAYLVGRVCIRSPEGFARFVKFYMIIVLVLLPFAIIEAFTKQPFLLDLIPNSIAPTYNPERWGMRRAQTVFAHPILFGVFVSSAFGLFWYMLRPTGLRIFSVFSVMAATIFSLSSGALISMTIQFYFIAWEFITGRLYWRWKLFAALAVLGYVTIDLLSNRTPFHVLVTYASFNTGSAYSRIQIWEWGMNNVWANPWFGLGLDVGNWERPYWKSGSADNFWLLTAMTYGVPSLVAFVGAVFLIIRQVARASLFSPLAKRCQAGFLVAAGGIIIAGGTVHYWHAMLAFVMFFFGSGIWMIKGETEPQSTPDPDEAGENDPRALKYTRFPATPVTRGASADDTGQPADSAATPAASPPPAPGSTRHTTPRTNPG